MHRKYVIGHGKHCDGGSQNDGTLRHSSEGKSETSGNGLANSRDWTFRAAQGE